MPERNNKVAYVYMLDNGAVFVEYHDPKALGVGNSNLAMNSYMVIVNHPAKGNSAPFAEIIKSRYGRSGIIATDDGSHDVRM